jgi:ParB family chromosome partitioning protein
MLNGMAARRTRRKAAEPASLGLTVEQVAESPPPRELAALEQRVAESGGAVLARYRDPLGGSWLALAALPVAAVRPTPFQRDLSEPHVKRLEDVIRRVGSFLDPIVAIPAPRTEGERKAAQPTRSEPQASEAQPDAQASEVHFWTPNGYHRLSALGRMGVRTITALVSPDPALAYRILALNTEKAHTTRERALEAMRMARGLAEIEPKRHETEYALELEDGSLVTLGLAYEARPRLAGGAYAPALKASDAFLDEPIARALERRQARAQRLLALDERVAEIIESLKARGFQSPYLRNFVVARLRPFRPRGKPAPEADALLDHMEKAAAKFDAAKIREDQVASAAGGGED